MLGGRDVKSSSHMLVLGVEVLNDSVSIIIYFHPLSKQILYGTALFTIQTITLNVYTVISEGIIGN